MIGEPARSSVGMMKRMRMGKVRRQKLDVKSQKIKIRRQDAKRERTPCRSAVGVQCLHSVEEMTAIPRGVILGRKRILASRPRMAEESSRE